MLHKHTNNNLKKHKMDIVEKNKLFTQAEVMEILRISRQALFQLRKDGKITAVIIGSRVRFSQKEIARISN